MRTAAGRVAGLLMAAGMSAAAQASDVTVV